MTTITDISKWPKSRIAAAFTAALPVYDDAFRQKNSLDLLPIAMRTPRAILLNLMSMTEDVNASPRITVKMFAIAMKAYISTGLLTPNYGDLYELASGFSDFLADGRPLHLRINLDFEFELLNVTRDTGETEEHADC